MFERLRRVIRSWFGWLLGKAEDPKILLEQSIRDMRDKVSTLNAGLVKMKSAVLMLEKEVNNYTAEEQRLIARVKAALENGSEDLAAQYAVELKRVQEAKVRSIEQLNTAKDGYDKAVELKKDYMRQMEAKTREAQQVMREAEAAKWKAEVADVFQTFEVSDLSATHNEMIDKLRQQSSRNEAKLAVATESVDMEKIKMEQRAEQIEAQQILEQFKLEMGLTTGPKVTEAKEEPAKTLGPAETTGTT